MSTSAVPCVSVIIPVYNGSRYLGAAIQSVLNQTFTNFELIVLDNASTDDTPGVIASFGDARVVSRRNPENLGFAGNVELGMMIARGKYVIVLGADDIMAPVLLERSVALLDAKDNLSLVHSDAIWIDENSQPYGESAASWPAITPGAEAFADVFRFGFSFATVLMRGECLRRFGGMNHSWGPWGDLIVFLRLCLEGDIGFIAEPLAWYRHHPENLSSQMHSGEWGGMLQVELQALDLALAWPESAKLNRFAVRRKAVLFITRRIIRMVHLARLEGGFIDWARNVVGALSEAPALWFYPSTWTRLGLGLLPPSVIQWLQRSRHERLRDSLAPPPDAWRSPTHGVERL